MTAMSGDDHAVYTQEDPGRLAYRFVAAGVLFTGRDVEVTQRDGWWHARQTEGDQVWEVDAEDERTLVLGLLAKRAGLDAAFGPADDRRPPPLPSTDPVFGLTFNAISRAAGAAGRFVSLGERRRMAEQVIADLRAAGVIA